MTVTTVANRSSVLVTIPVIAGAKDYRAWISDGGVTTKIADTEDVLGTTITCAGLRQRNECDDSEAQKAYGNDPLVFVANCSDDVRAINAPKTALQQIEVNLSGPATLVVEAIDRLCPFPGAIGQTHRDVPIAGPDTKPVKATYQGAPLTYAPYLSTFPIRTADEVRAQYGSLILNGQGPAAAPEDPTKGPTLGVAQPAAPNPPKVLARAIISVAPTNAPAPTGYALFDAFSSADPFTLLEARQNTEAVILPAGFTNVQNAKHYANSNWNRYTFNAEESQAWIENGELHSLIADIGQDVMSSDIFYPKQTFKVDDYLHITFETQGDATERRYWWLHMCGSTVAGETYSGTTFGGTNTIIATPFFMNPPNVNGPGTPGGNQISMAGWNCLQFVPRSGGYDLTPGGDLNNPVYGGSRSESSLRILQNRPTPAGQDPTKDATSVVLLDPAIQPGDTQVTGGMWTRTWNAQHTISGPLFDSQLFVAQRARYDVYVSRTKAILYADGVQKVCDDFASHPLVMAEAAVGLGHVFYHSGAERQEMTGSLWVRTGQNYYLHDTPFVDVRSFDNVGIEEGASLPLSFDPGPCFKLP
jgi:hypothetical protein